MTRFVWVSRDSRPVPRGREECSSGKLGWFSEADAELAAQHARRDHPDAERWPRGWYACTSCPCWHLTGRLQGGRGDV